MGRPLAGRVGLGVLLASGFLLGSAALAQQGTGIRAVFGVSQGFSADTNRTLAFADPGRSLVSTTNLNFGLRSETRTQQFSIQGQVAARLFDVPDDTRRFRFGSPDLSTSYRRDGANSGLSLSGRISRDNLRFLRPIDDFVIGVPLLDDAGLPVLDDAGEPIEVDVVVLPEEEGDLFGGGTRTRTDLSGRLDLGREGPLGLTVTASRQALRYADAPTESDRTRQQLGLDARLRLSPVTTGRVRLNFSRFDAEDALRTQRDRIGLRIGVRHAFSQRLVLDASLGPSRVVTRDRATGARRESRGIDGDIGLTYDLLNGTVGLSLAAVTNEDGTRRSLSVNRALDLPRGAISGAVGVARTAQGRTRATGRLDYRHELPRGALSLQARRDFAVNVDDEVEAFTSLVLGYDHAINSISSFGVDARYLSRTEDRASLTATYRRALTRDWNLNMGYRFDSIDRTAGRVTNHGVFLNLSRSFDFGL